MSEILVKEYRGNIVERMHTAAPSQLCHPQEIQSPTLAT